MDPKDFIHLLAEIRDLQREHLEQYRRVTQEQLELQRQAVRRQEQISRLYQRVVTVGALVLVALGLFLAWLVGAFR
jgi:ABC-type Na+ transport system ATPase subunit NatA